MNTRNYDTGNTSSSKNAVIGKNNSVTACKNATMAWSNRDDTNDVSARSCVIIMAGRWAY